ncbi:MAG: hypothetical protein Q8M08_13230 [Bacteroidales bacterium]|nr:hypothetical protein [Bacteroidales bacterium]
MKRIIIFLFMISLTGSMLMGQNTVEPKKRDTLAPGDGNWLNWAGMSAAWGASSLPTEDIRQDLT